MNKWNFSKIMLLLAFVVISLSTYAQDSNDEVVTTETVAETQADFLRYIYISGDFGLGLLDGENTSLKLGYNGHLGLGYQFDPYVGLKFNLGYGSLNGGFENITIDKLNYFETNINLTFDLVKIIFGYKPDRRLSVMPHIGVGQIQYRLNALNNDGSVFAQVGYEKGEDLSSGNGLQNRKVVATVPLGIELDFAITERWKLSLDFIATYADSDLIEYINGDYNNDWFYTFNLGANYKFNLSEKYQKANLIKVNPPACSKYWYMAVDGGASFLFGDNKANFSSMKSNINIGVGYNFGDYFRIYGRIGKGSITGQRPGEWAVLESNYLQASINFAADIVGLIAKTTDNKIELYPHIGVGHLQYRSTTAFYNSEWGSGIKQIGYNNDETNNTKGNGLKCRETSLTLPVGIELAYNVTERTDLYADATTYFTQSDLLDCIRSGKRNDAISTFNIGLRYKFNRACFEAEDECCITPDEVREAIQEALEQQKAEQEENKPSCITPEELKQAIKDAIEEYEANQPKCDDSFKDLSKATVINNNFSDISFPMGASEKVKTQTNIYAISNASIQVNDGSAVNRVIIEGYASPEGNKEYNERLARERAEQAAKIIQDELGEIDAERIEITTKGADWEGLYASLANSDIEDKDSIIEQLKNSENPEATLQEIFKSHPQVKELLPQLRRASIVITTVK